MTVGSMAARSVVWRSPRAERRSWGWGKLSDQPRALISPAATMRQRAAATTAIATVDTFRMALAPPDHRVQRHRSRGKPRESVDARDDLPKQAPCQVA